MPIKNGNERKASRTSDASDFYCLTQTDFSDQSFMSTYDAFAFNKKKKKLEMIRQFLLSQFSNLTISNCLVASVRIHMNREFPIVKSFG